MVSTSTTGPIVVDVTSTAAPTAEVEEADVTTPVDVDIDQTTTSITAATQAPETKPSLETRTTAPDDSSLLTTPMTFTEDTTEPSLLATSPSVDVEEPATESPEIPVDVVATPAPPVPVDEATIYPSTEDKETATDAVEPAVTSVAPETEVPGEGSCYQDGITYANGADVPTSSECQESCFCQNSIVACTLTPCPSPPSYESCHYVEEKGGCCPVYVCGK